MSDRSDPVAVVTAIDGGKGNTIAQLGLQAMVVSDVSSFMGDVVALIAEALQVDLCGIFTMRPEVGLVLEAGWGWQDEAIGQGCAGSVVSAEPEPGPETQEPAAGAEPTLDDLLRTCSALTDHGVVSAISAVIPAQPKPSGLLCACSISPRDFLPSEVEFLQAIANVVGAARIRLQLEQSLVASEAERERLLDAEREQRLLSEILRDITLALTAHVNPQDVLEEILTQARRLVPYTAANIALVEGEFLHVVGCTGYEHSGAPGVSAMLPQKLSDLPVSQSAILERRACLVMDTAENPAWVSRKETAWIRSSIVIPLVRGEQVVGLLQLDGDTPHQLKEVDLSNLQPLAYAAVIALENARLYQQARRDAETKAKLLNTVNHRVKNNLAAIIGLLQAERPRGSADEQLAFQQLVEKVSGRIIALSVVHDMLSVNEWSALPLDELILRVSQGALRILPYHQHIALMVTPSTARISSRQANSVGLVIHELVANTVSHGLNGRNEGAITIDIDSTDGRVLMRYCDDGPGYPDDALSLERRGVGMRLIESLVSRDLCGDLSLANENGAVAIVNFHPLP